MKTSFYATAYIYYIYYYYTYIIMNYIVIVKQYNEQTYTFVYANDICYINIYCFET